MTQRTFHAELNSREFPYNFRELSSTVVFNQGSEIQRGIPGGFAGADAEKNFGVCQAYYLDNVMPISRGYSSVAFNSVVPPIGSISNIIASFDIIGEGDQIALFVATQTSAYVYDPNGGQWQQLDIGATSPELVSYALVKEVTYIYYGYSVYIYNFEGQQLEPQTLVGIADPSLIRGIAAAGAQMIAWDESNIYTSSVLNPLDFNIVDGLSTGAGVTGVLALKGVIVACLSLGQDFIIYTNRNAVSGRQTGSLQFPFVYKEIRGSAGISTVNHVAYNSNNESHIAWTPSGFQEINLEAAQYIWPELSDGITRGLRTFVDSDFGLPELLRCNQIDVKINFLSNRWLVVSTRDAILENEGYYTDGYVLDTLLGRWGKLTVPHVSVLQFGLPEVFNQYTYDQFGLDYQLYDDIPVELVYAQLRNNDEVSTSEAGNNLGLLREDGSLYTVSWSETSQFRGGIEIIGAARPRIIFGKYKAFRTRGMVHQSLKVNKLHGANIKLYGHDYTGRYVDIKDDLVQNDLHTGQWFGRLNADSISIGFDGEFIISDLSFVSSDSGTINQKYQQLETLLVATTDVYPLEDPVPPGGNILEDIIWDADELGYDVFIGESGRIIYILSTGTPGFPVYSINSLEDTLWQGGADVSFNYVKTYSATGGTGPSIYEFVEFSIFWRDDEASEGYPSGFGIMLYYDSRIPEMGVPQNFNFALPEDLPVTPTARLVILLNTYTYSETQLTITEILVSN